MLHVQEYLLTRSPNDLAKDHGVYANPSACGRKIAVNYDQIESKESDPLARQCRGLIIARADHAPIDLSVPTGDTVVVARSFDRFFNHGQQGADASVMFSTPGTRVFEKLDGSMVNVHYDRFQGRWHTATRSIPEADRPIDGTPCTFRTLFEHALRAHLNLSCDDLTARLDTDRTYVFELTTPFNQIVVRHAKPQVHLLAIRETATGREFCPVEHPIAGISVPVAPQHEIRSTADLVAYVSSRSPFESEGVVVRGPGFTRIKVKNPAYVALNGLRDSVSSSPRRLMEVVLLGKEDDVLPTLPPEVKALGEAYRDRFAAMVRSYDGIYEELRATAVGTENPRKTLALAVQARGLWMPFFMDKFTSRSATLRNFVDQKRNNDGSWPDAFLDMLIRNLPDRPSANETLGQRKEVVP